MNRLQSEKSPYLLQHAKNPVNWFPWDKAAFETAQREDKPIFLSIGYSTCHWCHVMAKESFEAEDVAATLNRNFVSIKVDREERPDIDSAYMSACIAMNGSGGWPLTALLTPDQKPFWTGTYLPKAQLLSLLSQTSHLWREHRNELASAGEQLTAYLRREKETSPGIPNRELVKAGVSAFSAMFDAQWGGFGDAPKFPSAHNLLFLLRYAEAAKDAHAQKMAEVTLERMYRGGIFDHVGGGFSRYATDRIWLAPHFEKMLYDNALLSLAYTEAYQQTKRPYYREVIRRTLDYVLRELSDPLGGFYCGQDADSNGEEGKYYVFTHDELASALGAETEAFCHRFGVTEKGNFHGKTILNLINTPDWEKSAFATALQKLYEYRSTRSKLHRDDKVLTAWNGLMIAAFARAGFVLDDARYTAAAIKAAEFIREHLTNEHGRLLARWREGNAAYPGKLDDYAFLVWGLLELYETTFHMEYLAEACRLSNLLLDLFFDEKQGGFYPYATDGEQLITRTKELYDGAMPSGNAVAGLTLSRLARLTGGQRWHEASEKQFHYMVGAVKNYPAGHAFTLLAFLEELWSAGELVCVAKEPPPELLHFLRERSYPGLTILLKTPENAKQLTLLAPFTQAYPIQTTEQRYYLCREGHCTQPVSTVENLQFAQRTTIY